MSFNSLWPSDTIWQQRSGSTLAQVMACCLMARSHYLNQCRLIMNEDLWQSPDSNFPAIYWWYQLENCLSNISFKSPRGQWVNYLISPWTMTAETQLMIHLTLAPILQTTFSDALLELNCLCFDIHWNLFPRVQQTLPYVSIGSKVIVWCQKMWHIIT